jgi:hypothetical protein
VFYPQNKAYTINKMQGSSNNSFIPKRRNSKRQHSVPGRKIFIVTIISYSLLSAALLAAGAAVLYKNYMATQLANEAASLDSAVRTFSVQDFKRVQEFDATLTKAKVRVDNTVSIVAVLDELDRITAQPIQINDFKLQRRGDQDLLININFTTETLDAALFQRKMLTVDSVLFSDVEISEIIIQNAQEATSEGGVFSPASVTFLAEFSAPVTTALYDPAEARQTGIGIGQQTGLSNISNDLEFEAFDTVDPDFENASSTSDEIVPPEQIENNETAL